MAQSDNTGNFKLAPTCQSGSKILYAWAMDATSLDLPEGKSYVHIARMSRSLRPTKWT